MRSPQEVLAARAARAQMYAPKPLGKGASTCYSLWTTIDNQ